MKHLKPFLEAFGSLEKKCKNCGVTYERGVGKNLCSNSCKILNLKKYKNELAKAQREIYKKYFG